MTGRCFSPEMFKKIERVSVCVHVSAYTYVCLYVGYKVLKAVFSPALITALFVHFSFKTYL